MSCNCKTFTELGTILKLAALIFLCLCCFMHSDYFLVGSTSSHNFLSITAAGGVSIEGILLLLRLLDKESGKEPEAAYGLVWGVFCLLSALFVLLSSYSSTTEWLLGSIFFICAGAFLLVDSVLSLIKK